MQGISLNKHWNERFILIKCRRYMHKRNAVVLSLHLIITSTTWRYLSEFNPWKGSMSELLQCVTLGASCRSLLNPGHLCCLRKEVDSSVYFAYSSTYSTMAQLLFDANLRLQLLLVPAFITLLAGFRTCRVSD